MSTDNILVEFQDKTAILTINRPDRLNALNRIVMGEIERAMFDVEREDKIRAVIVTGSGEKAFVAGADIKEMDGLSPTQARTHAAYGQRVVSLFERCRAPVIAAINGFALGGGLELALACDIRLAADNAELGLPEVGLGLIPGFGGTQRLARLIGKGRALEMMVTARRVKAEEALSIGLVNQVVPRGELMAKAHELATKISSNAPIAVQMAKQSMHDGLDTDLKRGLDIEASLFGLIFSTKDYQEGVKAFIEKRKPTFSGE